MPECHSKQRHISRTRYRYARYKLKKSEWILRRSFGVNLWESLSKGKVLFRTAIRAIGGTVAASTVSASLEPMSSFAHHREHLQAPRMKG
jgi:hypothetical protein